MLIFNNLEVMKKYYNKKTNTYEFYEDGELQDIEINFNIAVQENIKATNITAGDIDAGGIDAYDIKACDIKVNDIHANDIKAENIDARNISYFSVCFARKKFICKSITGRRENSRHFCLDGEIKFKE